MAKCTKCKKVIKHLAYVGKGYLFGDYDLKGGFSIESSEPTDEDQDFYCPKCEEAICKDEDTAIRFLES